MCVTLQWGLLFRIMKTGLGSLVSESYDDYSNIINATGFHLNSFIHTHTVSVGL